MFRFADATTLDMNALFNASPNAYVLFDPSLVIAGCNDAYLSTVGRSSREEIVGRYVFDAFPTDTDSDSYRLLKDSLDRVIATVERDHIALIPYDTAQAGQPPLMRYWSATHTPILDDQGNLRYILQHTVDVTELQTLRARTAMGNINEAGVLERAAIVQAHNTALSQEVGLLRSLFRQAPGFVAVLAGPNHVFELTNEAYERLVGRTNLIGKSVAEGLPEVVDQGFVGLLDQVLKSGEPFIGRSVPVELAAGDDGEPQQRVLDFIYQPIRDAAGANVGVFVQGHDITAQKAAEAQLQTVAQESAHRVKNLLAMIQAMVSQTLRRARSVEEASESLSRRVQALGAAQSSLTAGARGNANVVEVVQSFLALHADNEDRFRVDGPDCIVGQDTALGLALVLHELATNAVKYGALSREDGHVALNWRIDPAGHFAQLTWSEAGGPKVTAPDRQGFGSNMIQRMLPPVDGMASRIEYRDTGVIFTARLRLLQPEAGTG